MQGFNSGDLKQLHVSGNECKFCDRLSFKLGLAFLVLYVRSRSGTASSTHAPRPRVSRQVGGTRWCRECAAAVWEGGGRTRQAGPGWHQHGVETREEAGKETCKTTDQHHHLLLHCNLEAGRECLTPLTVKQHPLSACCCLWLPLTTVKCRQTSFRAEHAKKGKQHFSYRLYRQSQKSFLGFDFAADLSSDAPDPLLKENHHAPLKLVLQ
eukprot:3932564-Rhodomonas_salina.1